MEINLDSNSYQLLNTANFVFDMARFEGFKSSGYLRLRATYDLASGNARVVTSKIKKATIDGGF